MPALAPAIGAAIAFFSTPIGGFVLLGIVAGVSALINRPPDSASAQDTGGAQLELRRGEDTVLDAVLGRSATGGQLLFHYETGDDNDYLNLVIRLGSGLHDSLEALFVDGEVRTLSGSNSDSRGRVVGGFEDKDSNPLMWVKFYNGTTTQTADPRMVSEVADSSRWGTDHRLTGHCYAIISIKYDQDVFNGSEPQFLFQLKGLRLYDWRKDSTMPGGSGSHVWGDASTYEWTENPAVILYNYRRGIYIGSARVFGLGTLLVDNDLAKFTAAANTSDESVYYPDTDVTVPRYHVGMILRDDMDPQSVIRTLEESMGGFGASPGGVYGPLPAMTTSSVMTILDDDIQLGYPRTAKVKLPPSSTYNRVQGQFSDPSKAWQMSPYGVRKDATVETAQGGPRTLSLDLGHINVYETAQLIAEIKRRRDLFTKSESLVVRPKFMVLEPGDVVTRTTTLFGTIAMTVMSREELADGSISLTLREWNNAIVPNGGDDYVPVPPTPAPVPPTPSQLLAVPGFDVTAIDLTDGTAIAPAFKATWTAITDQTVDRVIVRYYPQAVGLDDVQYASVPRGTTTSVVLTGLAPNTDYVIQAKLETTPWRPGLDYTTAIVRTSGSLAAEAEIPPIAPEDLGPELAAERGLLVGTGPGSLSDLIDEWNDQLNQLAGAVTTNSMVTEVVRKMVTARFMTAAAAVFQEAQVRASEDSALATQITEVLAQVDDVIAGGYLRLEALVDPGGALSTVTAKAKASFGAAFSQAAWILRAEANGSGGTNAYFGVLGNFYVFNTVDGVPLAALSVVDGQVRFNGARAGLITSPDGVSMRINFETPEIYMKGTA
jgi:hypothetical protein